MARTKTTRSSNSTSTNITPIDRKGTVENVAPEGKKATNGNNGNMEEEIRRRAYELYEKRGGEHGRAQEDWFQAEAEIRARTSSRSA
jgi:hypothetical protein